jgi:hypothetical protein
MSHVAKVIEFSRNRKKNKQNCKAPRSKKFGNLAVVAGCNARRTARRSASTASGGQRGSVPGTASKIAELFAARGLRESRKVKKATAASGGFSMLQF